MAGTGADTGFRHALARFKAHLSPAEQDEFSITSLADLQETIVRIQQAQGSERKMRNLTRIKSFLEAMVQYCKVVEVFVNVSDIFAFVWGPMKFLLQIASTWVESFDVLLDAYEEISENLPQLLKYSELFKRHTYMRKVLELMYGDILEFHRRALRFFSRPTWKQLFRSSWKTFRTQFQYILNNLSRYKSLVESQASLVDYEQSERARLSAQNSFEEIASTERLRRRLAVTEKIHAPNTLTDHVLATEIRQEYPDSGRWILRHAALRNWMDFKRPGVPVLWVIGTRGAGKTVIASLIIEEMKNVDSVYVGFFYCKYSDNQKNSFTDVLRSILVQLVQQNEELLSYVYDACCSTSEFMMDSQKLLKELVETSLRSCPNTCIIIDGIDECEETEEKKTIAWFLAMCQKFTKDNGETIRLLFVSQRDKVTENLLAQAAVIPLHSKDRQEDSQKYAFWTPNILWNFMLMERPLGKGKKRVRWRCGCGRYMYDDFTELRSGAAAELEAWLNHSMRKHADFGPFDSQQKATLRSTASPSAGSSGHQQIVESNKSLQPLALNAGTLSGSDKNAALALDVHLEKCWLLICGKSKKGPDTLLTQLDLSSTASDNRLFVSMKDSYSCLRKRWSLRSFLRGVKSIRFVQFQLHKSARVDIRKSPDMPPETRRDEYLYEPYDLIPPVGEAFMTHWFHHPEEAWESLYAYSLFPKRRKGELEINSGPRVGWGIQIVEGWIGSRVWLLSLSLFLCGSLAFAISWTILEHDIQGAFGVSAYVIALLTLAVGTAQANLG